MKEIQIPRKNFARSSDPELKNRKSAEKKQSATVSDLSVKITKEPADFDPIYFAISDYEAESFLQGSSVDLLPTPEVCDESPVSSTVTHKAFHIIDAIPADLPASVQSLRAEIGDLKKTIYSVKSSEGSNCIDALKFRIVIFAFILWALFAAVVVSVSSGEEVSYSGPLPT